MCKLWRLRFEDSERRRDELVQRFIAPYRNYKPDDKPGSYARDADGYIVRGVMLMFCMVGVAYAEKMSSFATSTAFTSLSMKYRLWLTSPFPDSYDGRDGRLGGYYHWDGEMF